MTPSQVARTISLYGIAALVGTLIGGQMADRFGAGRTILASLFGLAVCLATLGFSLGNEVTAETTLMLASVAAQLFFPAQQARLAAEFPQRRATVSGLEQQRLVSGISLGSLIGGQAMAAGGFRQYRGRRRDRRHGGNRRAARARLQRRRTAVWLGAAAAEAAPRVRLTAP